MSSSRVQTWTEVLLLRLLFSATIVGCDVHPLVWGQQPSPPPASVKGIVTDLEDTIIPEALVTLKYLETNYPRETKSNNLGEYLFAQLPPGSYELKATAPGFSTESVQLDLLPGRTTVFHIKLRDRSKGQITREEKALRDQLETDKSIMQVPDYAWTTWEASHKAVSILRKINAIKKSLYEAASSRKGVVKAKRVSGTEEGGTVATYLIVENGRITAVKDYSRDPWGPPGVHSYRVDRVRLGYLEWDYGEYKFIPLKGRPPKNTELVIEYHVPGEGYRYF